MKLLIAAALLVAPVFADCCSYERVRIDASRARYEVQRVRVEAMREARRYRMEMNAAARHAYAQTSREMRRVRTEARRAAREAYRNSYRDRRWFF